MPDIIHLLPDSVANQIAAGEVIQRPASAVKELMENSVDAGATDIQLNIKDAGKTLIQVIDNGCGMSLTDARMSFERHATSKIQQVNDLFAIRTMGFRGEALASIAAIAQVELRSKRAEDELGTCISVEASVVKSQEPCACTNGTVISIKNLFFNVPARRVFLKSNLAETNHILEEFSRVALAHPEISFSFYHNEKNVIILPKSSLKQRIVGFMGNIYNERLLTVEQETANISITGFIGKPEFARKTRGEQYFFVNRRYIKHAYLHHSVENAFKELLPGNTFPSYFLYFEVDTQTIDINIHPTKTEINFQDSKIVYAVLQAAVKQALGKYSFTPTLDFDAEQSFSTVLPKDYVPKAPTITINPDYNPFQQITPKSEREKSNAQNWEKIYTGKIPSDFEPLALKQHTISSDWEKTDEFENGNNILELKQRYIVCNVKSGLMIIDRQQAHERIIFNQLMKEMEMQSSIVQRLLFPQTIHFSAGDMDIVNALLPQLKEIGFEINNFGQNCFIVDGIPASMSDENIQILLEEVIENFKQNKNDLTINRKINIALYFSKSMAIKPGKVIPAEALHAIIGQLFATDVPYTSPSGKSIITVLTMEELSEKFK